MVTCRGPTSWPPVLLLYCLHFALIQDSTCLQQGIRTRDVTTATMSPTPAREEVIIPGNDPGQCRCGEAIMRGYSNSGHSILDEVRSKKTTTTQGTTATTTATPLVVIKRGEGSSMNFFSPKNSGKMATTNMFAEEDFVDYIPERRPWLVVIRIQDFPPESDVERIVECTGAILSTRWVISSQSCICEDKFGCDVRAKIDESKLRTVQPYELYMAGTWPDQVNEQLHGIEGISVPPKDLSTLGNDVVMLRLATSLAFSEKVMPICLPQLKFKNDTKEAYISGFRLYGMRSQSVLERCRTIAGPSRDKRCKNYKLQYSPNITYDKCTFESPPRAKECLQLRKYMNWTRMVPAGIQKVVIIRNISQIDEKERLERFSRAKRDMVEIECYSENPSEYGWCGTCLTSAKKGEPGYCQDDEAEEGEPGAEDEMARPTEFGGWGFCEKMCSISNLASASAITLLETMRLLESRQDCQKHYKTKNNRFIHICLASLRFVHKRLAYRLHPDGRFTKDESEDMYVLNPDLKSVGDAGAPVFQLTNYEKDTNRANAVLIGILSTSQSAPKILVAENKQAKTFTENIHAREIITQVLPQMKFIKEKLSVDPPECIPKTDN